MSKNPFRSRVPDWDSLRGALQDSGADRSTLEHFDEFRSRREFFGLLGRGGAAVALTGMGAGLHATLSGLFGRGMIPVAWAQEAEDGGQPIPGKEDMTLHNQRPINGEFAPHLLDDSVTPTPNHFVRNNALVPKRAYNQDAQGWAFEVDGEVNKPLKLTLADLQKMPQVSMPLLIECGGNGRAFFEPPVRGNPWGRGAIGCSEWTGVRLRDVLKQAGLKNSAVYTAHYGEDPPIGGAEPFSRGVPIDKAMEEHTLIAYKMNGEDLHPLNGYPARVVVPGWIGSASQKWLNRITIRDQVHDAEKMTGYSYRVPAYPVVPGSRPPEEDMEIATEWLIKSMITRPEENTELKPGDSLQVAGHAWAGEQSVKKVEVSTDFGLNWQEAKLRKPPNKYAWYRWESELKFPDKGYYEIWARATDADGRTQPIRQPWNPKGYLGNLVHRVPVLVGVSA